jgi:hypothetical protein
VVASIKITACLAKREAEKSHDILIEVSRRQFHSRNSEPFIVELPYSVGITFHRHLYGCDFLFCASEVLFLH